MSRSYTLDLSPPPYNGPMDRLDKSLFQKTISVLAVEIEASRTTEILRNPVMKGALMDIPRHRNVLLSPADPQKRKLMLRFPNEADLPTPVAEYLAHAGFRFIKEQVVLDYDYWRTEEILHSFLPEELRDGSPHGYAAVGHIAHLNLNDEYLPYKYIIGQVILDKSRSLRTVVNKLNNIDTKFRIFQMELLAGEPSYVVEHSEQGCRFTFDFSKVYWNSRLHFEHERLVNVFNKEDVIVDVFAGVGPFCVPAGKKGCGVLANDLNPESYKYLQENVALSRVQELVRTYCEDGFEFIRAAVRRVYDEPFPAYKPRLSRTQLDELQKRIHSGEAAPDDVPSGPARNRISHFVMNLPGSAIEFLGALRGIMVDDERNLSGVYAEMPMIHCHCFSRALGGCEAEADILQRVEEQLGYPVNEDISLHFVRAVAPNKDMYCISFRLPSATGFAHRR
ncbi:hypothetical protein FISHEDRAFT_38827 [Fistulina hepatica ATCC 64428]|uniref:tRNA (guanine(37)-N1)-methyltransferase n=1 Tax=Fistulina hepatica ATCC 64428 TaxID=1128425 RepID=A0A0D7AHW0_9AGAR|nr:hypothetical protein FISHEDRAFT_38827 [Fistulina hepatica ATCC 64428]